MIHFWIDSCMAMPTTPIIKILDTKSCDLDILNEVQLERSDEIKQE